MNIAIYKTYIMDIFRKLSYVVSNKFFFKTFTKQTVYVGDEIFFEIMEFMNKPNKYFYNFYETFVCLYTL